MTTNRSDLALDELLREHLQRGAPVRARLRDDDDRLDFIWVPTNVDWNDAGLQPAMERLVAGGTATRTDDTHPFDEELVVFWTAT